MTMNMSRLTTNTGPTKLCKCFESCASQANSVYPITGSRTYFPSIMTRPLMPRMTKLIATTQCV